MRVVVVFCEGPHDIHFAARSVERHCAFQRYTGPAQALPTPFGWKAGANEQEKGLVRTQRDGPKNKRTGQDRIETTKLNTLNFGEKPLFELACKATDDTAPSEHARWLMFVNMGGDSSHERVRALAKLVRTTIEHRRPHTSEVAFAFLFDADPLADNKGLDWRLAKFRTDYAELLGASGPEVWTHSTWADTQAGRVGLWVHHDATTKEGTLEHHLGKMFENSVSHQLATHAAKQYIEANAAATSDVRTRNDKHWKAAMTIAGQVVPPSVKDAEVVGSGLNVMVEKSLPDEAFDAEVCKALATFLTSAWTTP